MHIAKWGNSLAVRLPKKLVDDLGLKEGDEVTISAAGSDRFEIVRSAQRADAIDRMGRRSWRLPEGYRFDRDEANER
jgi:antitoxin MazE